MSTFLPIPACTRLAPPAVVIKTRHACDHINASTCATLSAAAIIQQQQQQEHPNNITTYDSRGATVTQSTLSKLRFRLTRTEAAHLLYNGYTGTRTGCCKFVLGSSSSGSVQLYLYAARKSAVYSSACCISSAALCQY
eukprot:6266-Heterococcus_DN1.PRE.1